MTATVVIQAGHEAPLWRAGQTGTEGLPGILKERDATPVVADEATRLLRSAGVTVHRVPSQFPQRFDADLFLSCHFNSKRGGMVGFDDPTDEPAALDWQRYWYSLYIDPATGESWPRGGNNSTPGLRGYYGFSWVTTTISEFVIEFASLGTTEAEARWAKERLPWMGRALAWWAADYLVREGKLPTNPIRKPSPDPVRPSSGFVWQQPGDKVATPRDGEAALRYQGSINPDDLEEELLQPFGAVMDTLMQLDVRLRGLRRTATGS